MGRVMTTADEYRQYARECLQWAEQAETDDERLSLISMATDWTLAAVRLDGMRDGQGQEGQPMQRRLSREVA